MERGNVKEKVVEFGSLTWALMVLAESLIVFGLKY